MLTMNFSGVPARLRMGLSALAGAMLMGVISAASAQEAATQPAEIRIGNTIPYTGPAAAYGTIGRTIAAYFEKINGEGGINGRKITFISYDDAYNPAKTMELTRKLVEDDHVLLVFGGLGTAPIAAVRPYLNARKVPQLFVASGASMWDQPHEFPWTMGFQPSYQTEAHIVAQYLLENHPRGKIAILFQDDDFGKDYIKGLKDGLGGKMPIISEAPYKVSETNLDAQLTRLKASGADILVDIATPKFAAISIRRTAELGWKPIHFIANVSGSVSVVLKPAGIQNALGVLTTGYLLEASDPRAPSDPGYIEWAAFMDRYMPGVEKSNNFASYGYAMASLMVEVLRKCGNDLSRENIMKQAALLKDVHLPMILPGIVVNTSATDYAPLEQMVVMRFNGERWENVGGVRSGIDPGAVSDGFKAIFRYGSSTAKQTAGEQNANTVTMMTGTFDGTYVQIGADLASVLDDGANFRLLPIVGRGSVQAVADILFLKGLDAGIVRKDTLAYLERKGYADNIRNQLAYISKLYNEEMHILARRNIRRIEDLDGKSVAVGLPDGGTFVTSINVFERLGLKPHLIYAEPRVALELLRRGDIDALVSVEGKPLQWLTQVRDDDLHLVPINYAEQLQDDYLPAQIGPDDYPNLVAKNERVETIAAEAILASYNWQPNAIDRYRRLSHLVEAYFTHLDQLKQQPFHPKWREVAPYATVSGWTRAKPAKEWLDRHPMPATIALQGEAADDRRALFLRFLDEHAATLGPAINTPEGREAIFREFLQWQATRGAAR